MRRNLFRGMRLTDAGAQQPGGFVLTTICEQY